MDPHDGKCQCDSTTDRGLLTAEFYEWLQPVAAYTFHPWMHGQVGRHNIASP